MAMVNMNVSSLQMDSRAITWLGERVGGHLLMSLHLSNELGDSCHDDSTINAATGILTNTIHNKILTFKHLSCTWADDSVQF